MKHSPGKPSNPPKFAGLDMIPTDELNELKDAIDYEIAVREANAKAEGFESGLNSIIKQILNEGFHILVETTTDEIELDAKNYQGDVTVFFSV